MAFASVTPDDRIPLAGSLVTCVAGTHNGKTGICEDLVRLASIDAQTSLSDAPPGMSRRTFATTVAGAEPQAVFRRRDSSGNIGERIVDALENWRLATPVGGVKLR